MKMLLIIAMVVVLVVALALILGRSGGPRVTQITRRSERADEKDRDYA